MKRILLSLTVLFSSATFASAANLDSTHGNWNVYSNGKDACYIASVPVDEDGNFKKRGQPYVLINSKKKTDEVNISSGYTYKSAVDVEISVDNKKFKLFTKDENAWAKDATADKAIVTAMKSGAKLIVKGISSKNSYSTDTYSLKGAGAAYKRMKQLCK